MKRASVRRIELLKELTESRQNLYEVQKRSHDSRKAVQFFRRVFSHLNRGGRSHIMIISSYACRLLMSFSSLFFHLLAPFFSLLKTVTFYTAIHQQPHHTFTNSSHPTLWGWSFQLIYHLPSELHPLPSTTGHPSNFLHSHFHSLAICTQTNHQCITCYRHLPDHIWKNTDQPFFSCSNSILEQAVSIRSFSAQPVGSQ